MEEQCVIEMVDRECFFIAFFVGFHGAEELGTGV